MYIPALNRFDDPDAVRVFMHGHPFALLVSELQGAPVATPLPVTLQEVDGGLVLHGHLARANPQAAAIDGKAVLVVFGGPNAYVSPRHYDARESVPTWNYVTVHASGIARVVAPYDVPAHEALLSELIADQEPAYQQQWEALPERFRRSMLRGIVGFEVRVERLEGKAKLSQNKKEHERRRIATELTGSDDSAARATGRLMAMREGMTDDRAADAGGRGEPAAACPVHARDDD